MKRAAAAFVLFLGTLVTALWFMDFDATELGRELLGKASRSTGLALDASRARFNLLRGIQLEDVTATSGFPTGRYELTIARMRFEHRLAPLLHGELAFERVVIERPTVEIVYGVSLETAESEDEGGAGGRPRRRRRERAPAAGVEAGPSSLELRLRELVLRDGTILARDARRGESARITGVVLSLREPELASGAISLLHGLRAGGVLGAAELRVGQAAVTGVDAAFQAESGRLELAGSYRTDHGDFEGSAFMDFNSIPFRHRMSMTGRLGEADIHIDAEGFGLDAGNLKGQGRLEIAPDGSLWDRLELSGEPGRAVEMPLRIKDGRLSLEDDGLTGSIGLDGRLVLDVP